MNLAELIARLDDVDDKGTIYIQSEPEWSTTSMVTVCAEPADGGLPSEAAGMEYFLEVLLAKEILDVWEGRRKGEIPTLKEKCEAVIFYATNDTYLSGC
jgi:hypothetical protein